ncbi:MAG: cyclodeaminase/cyclohydrolase family protein [Candidatus Omnitrophica bacterium]|nr:cyclodeaminase/cyclohydrolase family protein [Candidatus Omnitrophota bacterium]MBU1851390.1 cyclodeaminase/cyclohydrolase family protein [Candidatus Omnitrophota bacterium]
MKEENACYLNKSMRKYLEGLSARTIAPGGGSAAAAVAAIGAGLNLMVISYSSREDETYSGQNEFVVLKEKQMASFRRLSKLIDEDCRVFKVLMDAIASGNVKQDDYIKAAGIPMEVCRESSVSLEVTALLMEDSNRNLLTDVGSAAHMLDAAFSSAALNVYVNLKKIKDKDFIAAAALELEQMKKTVSGTAQEISKRVKEALLF